MLFRRRREGFPGQHHCVLPPNVVAMASRHPLLRGLFPAAAGLYPRAAGHYVERRRGAPETVLLVCARGAGWVRLKEATLAVRAGTVVVLPPDEAHAYGSSDDDPWTIEWVHVAGEESLAWRAAIAGNATTVRLPAGQVADVGMSAVYQRLESGYGELQLLGGAAALRVTMTQLVRLRDQPGMLPTASDAVDASAGWMRDHLGQRITLAELAERARLSPSHYSAVFRRRFGYAPIDWLIRQRIQRACSLLLTQPAKIESIAQEVGIRDAYYFTRLFRKVMGVPPRTFRSHR